MRGEIPMGPDKRGGKRALFPRGSFQAILLLAALLIPCAVKSQLPHPPLSEFSYEVGTDKIWTVFGHVRDLAGQPLGGAKVHIEPNGPLAKPQDLETNLQGEFRTTYRLDATQYSRLNVQVTASRAGYGDGRESAEFGAGNKTWEIILYLRPESGNPDVLPLSSLVMILAPRFRSQEALNQVPDAVRKDYQSGAEELFGEQTAIKAVPLLAKAVGREANCLNCRLLLGLAQLDAGSWTGANQQFAEAEKLLGPTPKGGAGSELYVILGVLETWQQREKTAVGYFLKALDTHPSDPIVLLELGRTLVMQQDWESADRYLEEALKAGAPPEARLLHARALLEEGDADAAAEEMQAYLDKRKPRDLPADARMVYLRLQERLELKSFEKVKSVASQPLEELIRAMPELKGLEPARSQDDLPLILAKVGESEARFFRSFPNTVSLEEIRMENLRRDGTPKEFGSEKSNYLLMASSENWGLGIREYRTSLAGKDAKPISLPSGSIRTKGFASASSVFHPTYQSGTQFRYLGRQTLDGQETLVIAFAQQPEKTQLIGRFDADGVSSAFLLQGVAWVDAQGYQIVRLRTDLLKPLPKVRLIRETTEIHYDLVRSKESPAGLWLPREVIVTVQWRGRTFRNIHHYSDYKFFNVATEEKRKEASQLPGPIVNPN